MAPRFKRPIRKRRRPRSDGQDQRAVALHMSGVELLADADFENVSIAKFARTARCSVGAFYYRYKYKNAFLRQLISAKFGELENRLQNRISNSSGQISLAEFLSHIIAKAGERESVGIIRAAIKLGATDSNALCPYEDYREFVAMKAENIFTGGSKKKIPAREIREAVQIVFAAINDAALMPKSATMKLGSDDILNTLCAMAANSIGVRPDFKGKITKVAVITGNERDETHAINKKETPNKKKPARRQREKITVL